MPDRLTFTRRQFLNRSLMLASTLSAPSTLMAVRSMAAVAAVNPYIKRQEKLCAYFGKITERQAPTISLNFLPRPRFTFVLLTDVHLGSPGQLASNCMPDRVIEAWRQINALQPDFVLDLGDITTGFPGHGDHEPELDYALYLYKTHAAVPVHQAAGNHDVGNKQDGLHPWLISDESLRKYRDRFGADFYSFDWKDCHFICLNSQLFGADMPECDQQWQWLENDLQNMGKSRNVYVFMHSPVFLTDPETDPSQPNYEVINQPDRKRLLDLFAQHNVSAVYTGHTHWPFHNYSPATEFHTLYSGTFTRVFWPDKYKPTYDDEAAWRYCPYKVGYNVARVYDDRTIVQFVQSYPRLADVEVCQKDNDKPAQRVLPRSAVEMGDSTIGINAELPPIVYWRDQKIGSQRHYIVNLSIESAAQIGVQWMRLSPAVGSASWSPQHVTELDRLLTWGTPRGVKWVLPLHLDAQQAAALDFSPYKDRIAAYQILRTTADGTDLSPQDYSQIVQAFRGRMQEQAVEARLILGDWPVDALEPLQQTLSGLSSMPDVICLHAEMASFSEPRYQQTINKLMQMLAQHESSPAVWVHFTGADAAAAPLTPVPPEQAKLMLRLFAFNRTKGIRSIIDGRCDCGLSLFDHNYDPTHLYTAVAAYNTVMDGGVASVNSADAGIEVTGSQVRVEHFTNSAGMRYLVLHPDNSQQAPRYVDITLPDEGGTFCHLDPLTATATQLVSTSGNGRTTLSAVRCPDYPVFIGILP